MSATVNLIRRWSIALRYQAKIDLGLLTPAEALVQAQIEYWADAR